MTGASSISGPHAPRNIWATACKVMAVVCVLISGGTFLRHGISANHAANRAPGVAVTSGFEEESFFALWRSVHDQKVYSDPARKPYATAYFNWLFYASYSAPLRPAIKHSSDAAIPSVGRLMTAFGALAGVSALLFLCLKISPTKPLPAAALATFVYFGPLVGWWAHSVRPDIWALALETMGLTTLILHHRARPIFAAIVSGLFFYGAWSFKQTYFVGFGTAALFLITQRYWRSVAILVLLSISLWIITFISMGAAYQESFRTTGINNVFYLANGMSNFRDMLLKTLPLWLILMLLAARSRGRSMANPVVSADARRVGLLGLLISLPLAFAASCKLGAYSNYFFTPQLMVALLVAGFVATSEYSKSLFVGLTSIAALMLIAGLGIHGQSSLSPQAEDLAKTWNAWKQEPEPRYAVTNSLNLPWLNPNSTPFVLAYNYTLDRHAGRIFEDGGIGGLIANGYFKSILLPAGTENEYDGGSMRLYKSTGTIGNLTIFRRRDTLTE